MGRFLCCGVATTILVRRKRNVKVEDYKDKILYELKKYFNLDDYNMEITDEYIGLELKLDVFNNNIYELIKEIEPINSAQSTILFNKGLDIDNLNKDMCNIELKTYDDNYEYESDYQKEKKYGSNYLVVNDECHDEFSPCYISNIWTFYDIRELLDNFQVDYDVILLWSDFWKYIGEDETAMLYILNTMKNKFYNNQLGKDLIYTLIG